MHSDSAFSVVSFSFSCPFLSLQSISVPLFICNLLIDSIIFIDMFVNLSVSLSNSYYSLVYHPTRHPQTQHWPFTRHNVRGIVMGGNSV